MKYIISESRLDNVIFKYLDSTFENIEIKKGKYSDIVFAFHDQEYGLMGWIGKKSNQLFTYYEIVNEVKTMFSMGNSDALDVIGRYVESRYNLKVNKNWLSYQIGTSRLTVDS
jgi:hypothetical protein